MVRQSIARIVTHKHVLPPPFHSTPPRGHPTSRSRFSPARSAGRHPLSLDLSPLWITFLFDSFSTHLRLHCYPSSSFVFALRVHISLIFTCLVPCFAAALEAPKHDTTPLPPRPPIPFHHCSPSPLPSPPIHPIDLVNLPNAFASLTSHELSELSNPRTM